MSLCFVPDYLRPENNSWTAADGSMMIFCVLTIIVLIAGFGTWKYYLKRDKRRTRSTSWFAMTYPHANFYILPGFDRTKGIHQPALDVLDGADKKGLPPNIESPAIFYQDYTVENSRRRFEGVEVVQYANFITELETMGFPSTNTAETHEDVQEKLRKM